MARHGSPGLRILAMGCDVHVNDKSDNCVRGKAAPRFCNKHMHMNRYQGNSKNKG